MHNLWISKVKGLFMLIVLYTRTVVLFLGGGETRALRTVYESSLQAVTHTQKLFLALLGGFVHPFHRPYNLNNYINK